MWYFVLVFGHPLATCVRLKAMPLAWMTQGGYVQANEKNMDEIQGSETE